MEYWEMKHCESMTHLHALDDKSLQRWRKTLQTILLVTLQTQACDVCLCFIAFINQTNPVYLYVSSLYSKDWSCDYLYGILNKIALQIWKTLSKSTTHAEHILLFKILFRASLLFSIILIGKIPSENEI